MFAMAIVAILAVGAFSWIAIDSTDADATMMEGAIYVVVRRSDPGSSQTTIHALDSMDIEGDSLEDLDSMLKELN